MGKATGISSHCEKLSADRASSQSNNEENLIHWSITRLPIVAVDGSPLASHGAQIIRRINYEAN